MGQRPGGAGQRRHGVRPVLGDDMRDYHCPTGMVAGLFEEEEENRNRFFPPRAISPKRGKFETDDKGGAGTDAVVEDETEEQEQEDGDLIRCAQCLHAITREEDRIVVSGAHTHTFANPNGVVFEIGCFGATRGLRFAGPPTEEFTWFSGYAWRIAVCEKCLLHLGWLYVGADKESFAGLIVDRLVYPQ